MYNLRHNYSQEVIEYGYITIYDENNNPYCVNINFIEDDEPQNYFIIFILLNLIILILSLTTKKNIV